MLPKISINLSIMRVVHRWRLLERWQGSWVFTVGAKGSGIVGNVGNGVVIVHRSPVRLWQPTTRELSA